MPLPPRQITVNGVTRPIHEWSSLTGVPAGTIRTRLDRFGWEPARTVTPRPTPGSAVAADYRAKPHGPARS